jgi:hypothetical protein
MTNGGLLQLVAYGAQDVYLTANPQITFFKQLYRRHSNFAMEAIEQPFNGIANFGKRVTATVARNGDLATKMYIQVTLPSVDSTDFGTDICKNNVFSWIPYVGQYLLKKIDLEIGGQLIDRHFGDWLHIWNELTLPAGKTRAYLELVNGYGGMKFEADGSGCNPCSLNPTLASRNTSVCLNPALASNGVDCLFQNGVAEQDTTAFEPFNGCLPETTLYIPLEFWFNRHVGLALPLIALQYHDVKISIEFNELRYLCNVEEGFTGARNTLLTSLNNKGLIGCSLYVDYIYLDTEERRRFAQVAHEYLIEQLQYTADEIVTSTYNKVQLSFNHPVKEVVWVVQNPAYIDGGSHTNCPWRYTDGALNNPVVTAKLQLNGQDRFQEREGKYFNFVQPYQFHTNTPSTGINVYSFALKPEDLQPSGTCNFSRLDNAILNVTLSSTAVGGAGSTSIKDLNNNLVSPTTADSANVRVYATNYNVLRIMSGMAALAYSN